MILFFGQQTTSIFAVEINTNLSAADRNKLVWLFGDQPQLELEHLSGDFIGPRAAMITPWSTNAVEITQNMGIEGISRIELFHPSKEDQQFDPMISQKFSGLGQQLFTIDILPEAIKEIKDISAYNQEEGLALSEEEITYLNSVANKIGRSLTDSEVFGFSQVNSEHCRHKMFQLTRITLLSSRGLSRYSLLQKLRINLTIIPKVNSNQ